MSDPALSFARPTTRRARHVATQYQRRVAEWELCCCPSCLTACPERRAILRRRQAVLKARFRVEE